jgi:hypothetical protein
MRSRVPVLLLFVLAIASSAAAQQPAPQYPPGAYQPQPAPYPQGEPTPYAQPQPVPAEPMQPQPYPQPYPQPSAAPPGYDPAAMGYPGYGPPPEAPQEMPSSAGAIQLSLGMQLVRYRATSMTGDDNGGEADVSTLNWGFANSSPIQLEIGYGITDQIIVGGVLQLGGDSDTFESGGMKLDESTFDFVLMPKGDYQFSPGSKLNPFVGAMLGIGLTSQSAAGLDTSMTMFVMQARVGLRYFLTDSLSVDPALVGGFGVGGGSQEANGTSVGFSSTAFQVGLAVGLSGWLR